MKHLGSAQLISITEVATKKTQGGIVVLKSCSVEFYVILNSWPILIL